MYKKRIPPYKISLDINEFNILVQILSNMINYENENISRKSSNMKDKLLRYSIPITNDDENTIIEIRCFQDELLDLFLVLFNGVKNCISVDANYYNVLIQVREKLKENRN